MERNTIPGWEVADHVGPKDRLVEMGNFLALFWNKSLLVSEN